MGGMYGTSSQNGYSGQGGYNGTPSFGSMGRESSSRDLFLDSRFGRPNSPFKHSLTSGGDVLDNSFHGSILEQQQLYGTPDPYLHHHQSHNNYNYHHNQHSPQQLQQQQQQQQQINNNYIPTFLTSAVRENNMGQQQTSTNLATPWHTRRRSRSRSRSPPYRTPSFGNAADEYGMEYGSPSSPRNSVKSMGGLSAMEDAPPTGTLLDIQMSGIGMRGSSTASLHNLPLANGGISMANGGMLGTPSFGPTSTGRMSDFNDPSSSSATAYQFSAGLQTVKSSAAVRVIGFPPELASDIFESFAELGNVVGHTYQSGSNWMTITYSDSIGAQQALKRNLTVLEGGNMIVVTTANSPSPVISEEAPRAPLFGGTGVAPTSSSAHIPSMFGGSGDDSRSEVNQSPMFNRKLDQTPLPNESPLVFGTPAQTLRKSGGLAINQAKLAAESPFRNGNLNGYQTPGARSNLQGPGRITNGVVGGGSPGKGYDDGDGNRGLVKPAGIVSQLMNSIFGW
ncbi:hypothetical protein HDU76_006605 [Blyttiomyces sp. JEL0837]|nr:hypothetical protein HDU76_006605 [Blyttiomyces sp. JEL0837]